MISGPVGDFRDGDESSTFALNWGALVIDQGFVSVLLTP